MPAALPQSTQAKITRLLFLRQPLPIIAESAHVSLKTVYRIQGNLIRYGTPNRPRLRTLGCPRKITNQAEERLVGYLRERPDVGHAGLTTFLMEECGIECSQATMSRFLARERKKMEVERREGHEREEGRVVRREVLPEHQLEPRDQGDKQTQEQNIQQSQPQDQSQPRLRQSGQAGQAQSQRRPETHPTTKSKRNSNIFISNQPIPRLQIPSWMPRASVPPLQ